MQNNIPIVTRNDIECNEIKFMLSKSGTQCENNVSLVIGKNIRITESIFKWLSTI